MLDAPVASILAAIIAFLGTMLGLVIGYRRWAKERTSARYAKFETDRQEIYKNLWERVEDVNVAFRRDRVDKSKFAQLVGDLNEYMLRNGAHLDDSDLKLVNRYIAAAKRFHDAVRASGAEAQIPYGQTQEIPSEITQKVAALADAAGEASRLREELRRKVRTMLAGEPS